MLVTIRLPGPVAGVIVTGVMVTGIAVVVMFVTRGAKRSALTSARTVVAMRAAPQQRVQQQRSRGDERRQRIHVSDPTGKPPQRAAILRTAQSYVKPETANSASLGHVGGDRLAGRRIGKPGCLGWSHRLCGTFLVDSGQMVGEVKQKAPHLARDDVATAAAERQGPNKVDNWGKRDGRVRFAAGSANSTRREPAPGECRCLESLRHIISRLISRLVQAAAKHSWPTVAGLRTSSLRWGGLMTRA